MPNSDSVGFANSMIKSQRNAAANEQSVYRPLNMGKIRSKKSTFVSSEEALKEVNPIDWDESVLSGSKRVLLVEKK